MTVTLTDPIIAPSRITAAQVRAWYTDTFDALMPTDVADYLAEAERLCRLVGFDLLLIVAQSIHETSDPDTGKPWTSSWWKSRHNAAGIGITGDPAQNEASQAWVNGTDAARGHVVHLVAYADVAGIDWHLFVSQYRRFDQRYDEVFDAGFGGTVHVLGDLGNGRWATDPQYANGIVARANEIARFVKEEPSMPIGEYITDIPGLPGGPLRTTYQITMRIVPEGQTINRPGIKAKTPRVCVQHGNGNPNATAASDAQWLFNGARNDAGQPQQVSFHATADDTGVWMCIPADEVTWQAADGAGPGNMNGFSCEQSELAAIWANESRARKCIAVTADFMGRCGARLGIAKPGQHWDYNYNNPPNQRHDCPNKLRHTVIGGRPAWDLYVEQWNAARLDELGRMNPSPPVTPEAPKPAPIWWGKDDIGVQVNGNGDRALAMLAETHTRDKEATLYSVAVAKKQYALGTVKPGTTLTLRGTSRSKAGRKFAYVEIPGHPDQVARIVASNLVETWPNL